MAKKALATLLHKWKKWDIDSQAEARQFCGNISPYKEVLRENWGGAGDEWLDLCDEQARLDASRVRAGDGLRDAKAAKNAVGWVQTVVECATSPVDCAVALFGPDAQYDDYVDEGTGIAADRLDGIQETIEEFNAMTDDD